jgi:hypothetical protein
MFEKPEDIGALKVCIENLVKTCTRKGNCSDGRCGCHKLELPCTAYACDENICLSTICRGDCAGGCGTEVLHDCRKDGSSAFQFAPESSSVGDKDLDARSDE